MRVHASVHEPGAAPRASALQPASRRPPRTHTRRRRERSSRLLRTSGRRLDAAPIQKLTSCVSSGCPSPPPRRGTERARTGPDGSVWSVHCIVCIGSVPQHRLSCAPLESATDRRPPATSHEPPAGSCQGRACFPIRQQRPKKRLRDDRPKKQGRARDAGGAAAGPEEALWTTENSSRATQDRGC